MPPDRHPVRIARPDPAGLFLSTVHRKFDEPPDADKMLNKPTLRQLRTISLVARYIKPARSVAAKQAQLWKECTLSALHPVEYKQLCDAFEKALQRLNGMLH
jgi:hypothetical protein